MAIKVDECSKRIRRMIEKAMEEAENSSMKDRLGTVILANGKLISAGYNTNNRTAFDGEHQCSFHAEMSALWKLKGCPLYWVYG